ncbi:MAG: diguanylate cyclase [Candidatus Aminicenantes bacterium]|nr:diguanylate cyclase [Candidatus Aminicenantes bacterium]
MATLNIKKEKLRELKEKEKGGVERKHTIMIVDEKDRNLESLESLLSGDYHIIMAGDGLEALDTIKKMEKPENISLIIADQSMHGFNGIQLFEKLKVIIPNTIRIIITGYTEKEIILDAVNKTQIYQFILKPFDPEDLKLRVKRAVEAFEHQREIEESRITDDLTGLRNRRYVREYIEQDIAKANRDYENWLEYQRKTAPKESDLIFLMLDIDHFKAVNDEYDHEAGDMVLKQLADIMRRLFRDTDVLARWGGEEFLVISLFTNRGRAHDMAERLRWAVEVRLFDLGNNKEKNITCSIGFACYPFLIENPDALDYEKIISIADKALYAAKNSGRNAYVGIQSTGKTDPGNLFNRIQEDIEKLIDDGELEIYTSIKDRKLKWA